MKKLHSVVAVTALCIGAAMPAQAAAPRSQQQWCEINQGDAIRVFNQNAKDEKSKIATLTSSARAVNIHRDAFWSGGNIITGCQFMFRSVGYHHVLGRFNVERLSTGAIMVGIASWSAPNIRSPFVPNVRPPAVLNNQTVIPLHPPAVVNPQSLIPLRPPAVLDTQTLIPLRGPSVRCAAMHC